MENDMKRTILASAATIALTMGAAVAQELPPATGLTPGAPLGTDPYSGEGVVVGETSPADRAAVAPDPMLPAERPIAAEPMPADPVIADPAFAEPFPGEPVAIAQAPVAAGAPLDLAYPDLPSSAGLTPGAPLGSNPHSDQKAVAGEEFRAPGPGIFVR
jgi:hypothetical protein